jgi:putative hydrolase
MWGDVEIALGSVHGYYEDASWAKIKDGSMPREEALQYEMDKSMGLCRNSMIDVLAHPFLLYEKFYGLVPEAALRATLEEAKATGTAIEVNGRYVETWKRHFALIREINPLVSFGSDAHSTAEIHCVLKRIRDTIK